MKSSLYFFLKYTTIWILFFIVLKFLLVLYHFNVFSDFSISDLTGIFTYGAILDLSFTGYILIFPVVLLILSPFIKPSHFSKSIYVYSLILTLILSLLAVVDLEIFKWWGFRADKTIFRYMQVPAEILATASVAPVTLLTFIFILISVAFIYLHRKLAISLNFEKKKSFWTAPLFLLIGAFLVVPIRGGFQQIPVNQSAVYFSTNNLLNQAAVNLPWNFLSSIISKHARISKPYSYPEVPNARSLVNDLYQRQNNPYPTLVNKENPNVLIIIWESFTYKALEDPRNLTPNFNRLKKEGIFFNNIYASGERSDKGLIAVMSGYPALTLFSIMKNPVKSSKLPSLNADFKKKGYSTSFYYGGEPEFANLNAYLLSTGFEKIVQKNDFPEELQTSKWGVHDEHVFKKLGEDLKNQKEPFYSVFFTLSSHEPFDVPLNYLKNAKNNEEKFCNSIYYTDKCLGDFINNAKSRPWWDNTIVVIVADHGHMFPNEGREWANRNPDEFHIPMLLTGGAVSKDTTITTLASQTDLAATLLAQLKMDASKYIYSKNILDTTLPPFAYYAFNNGFGFLRPDKRFVYDQVGNQVLLKEGEISEADLNLGKAYQQETFRDYLEK